MEHRGGVCGDAGDGAGLTAAIPQAFFKEEAKRLRLDGARYLKPEDTLAVGVFFFLDTRPGEDRAAPRRSSAKRSPAGPVQLLGFRPVPTNDDALPATARDTRPGAIEQVLLKVEGDPAAAERWLYRRRLELRERFRPSRAGRLRPVALGPARQLQGAADQPAARRLLPGPDDPAFETGIAIFHRRYSTNTFPNWTLAPAVPAHLPQRRDQHRSARTATRSMRSPAG